MAISRWDWSRWRAELLAGGPVPFSLSCAGERSSGADDIASRSAIRLEGASQVYAASECVEWAPRLRNVGASDTVLLSDLQSIDLELAASVGDFPVTVHAVRGCGGHPVLSAEQAALAPGATWRISNPGGGKTVAHIPFVALDLGGRGFLCALGWPGRWTLAVEHDSGGSVRLTGGIQQANLSLRPGETITLPTVLLMFWEGDRLAAHNRFRQHLLRFHSPTCNGEPAPSLLSCGTWGGMKTANHLRLIGDLQKHRTPFDCYWMDAGWYGETHETDEYQNMLTEDWFFHVGDWRPNRAVHPDGLKPVADAAHAAGMRFLLWFEIERAIETSPWVAEHPEWYFSRRSTTVLRGRTCHWRVFNFGVPQARRAMTEHIAHLIEETGIDVLRQDCNVGLADCWDAQDTPGRIGMSEIRYVEGLLAFWDELRQRFPSLLLDIVQRRDLATISRALDLSRSDHEILPHTDPIASQRALYGLSPWTPLSGTGVPYRPGQDYVALSGLATSFFTAVFPSISDVPIRVQPPDDYPWDWLRRMLDIHRLARPYLRGDFYPLLADTPSNEHWAAFQFHRPDLGSGMVLLYRRPESPFTAARFRLRALQPGQSCHLDHATGGRLSLEGPMLQVALDDAPAAVVAFYRLDG